MFNKTALKILARENARLRAELRRKDRQLSELLDNFIFNKRPERLTSRPAISSTGGDLNSAMVSSYPSDAYSSLINELERDIDRQVYQAGLVPQVDIDEEDD